MEQGTCPKCNGSKRNPYVGEERWKKLTAGYDGATDTVPCDNCGGQKMYTAPTGSVPLRKDGTPCLHEYQGQNAGNCLTEYTCQHCLDRYQIDSGG